MNKQCFRVIFSKTLQRLVVVSELAKSEGKSTERNDFSISHVVAQLKPLTFNFVPWVLLPFQIVHLLKL